MVYEDDDEETFRRAYWEGVGFVSFMMLPIFLAFLGVCVFLIYGLIFLS